MQMTGYVILKSQNVLVLASQMKEYIFFKQRKSGKYWHHFQIEGEYMIDKTLERLLKGGGYKSMNKSTTEQTIEDITQQFRERFTIENKSSQTGL